MKRTLKPLRVISLGAGTQSSAMLIMSDRGELPRADFAVFADTQAEPHGVYEWLEFLKSYVSIPIHIGTKGDIIADHLAGVVNGRRCSNAPFFIKKGNSRGLMQRQCTRDYKIRVIRQTIKKYIHEVRTYKDRFVVTQMIGISSDESQRMRVSDQQWIIHEYPLVQNGITRQQCIEYVEKLTGRTPPRSACYMCPFHSNKEWARIKQDKETWEKAVEFDKAIRKIYNLQGDVFVHASCTPLDSIDFEQSSKEESSFNLECEGMCGL